MSALSIQPTYPIFTETDGQPLEDGYIWIGTANLDPQGNPINVYWDAALTQLAGQPIRTQGGYPVNSGTPARLYVNSDYSIRVMNKNGSTVYSAPTATERYGNIITASDIAFTGFNGQVGTVADLADADGSDWIGFLQSGPGAVAESIQDKLHQTVSVKDFGATGDGVTDDTVAIQNAINALKASTYGGVLNFPAGNYRITDTLDGTGLGTAVKISYIGEGKLITTITMDSVSAKPILSLGLPFTGLQSTGFRRISGLLFTATGTSNIHTGIYWQSANATAIVEDCQFKNLAIGLNSIADWGNTYRNSFFTDCDQAISLGNQPNGVVIDGCYIIGCTNGISLDEPFSVHIRNCPIESIGSGGSGIAQAGGNSFITSCYFESAAVGALASIFLGGKNTEPSSSLIENCLFNDGNIATAVKAYSCRNVTLQNNAVLTPTAGASLFENITAGFNGAQSVSIHGTVTEYRSDGVPTTETALKYLYKGDQPSQNLDIGWNGEYSLKGMIFDGSASLTANAVVSNASKWRIAPGTWNPKTQTLTSATIMGNGGTVTTGVTEDTITCVRFVAGVGGFAYGVATRAITLADLQTLFGSSAAVGFRVRAMAKNAKICFLRYSGGTFGNLTASALSDVSDFSFVELIVPPIALNTNTSFEFGVQVAASETGYIGPIQVQVIGSNNWYSDPVLDSF